MRKGGGREFFEVFRRMPTYPKGRHAKAERGPGERTSFAPAASPEDSGRFSLTLRAESLALLGVAVLGLLIASHIWGFRRGMNSVVRATDVYRAPSAAAGPSAGGSTARLEIRPAESSRAPFYTLRIISGLPLERAREITADLRAMRYDAFYYRPPSARNYTVNVGRFATLGEARASGLKERFAGMVYRGGQYFETCFYVQIVDSRGVGK